MAAVGDEGGRTRGPPTTTIVLPTKGNGIVRSITVQAASSIIVLLEG